MCEQNSALSVLSSVQRIGLKTAWLWRFKFIRRQTHRFCLRIYPDIYTPYEYMNNLYLIFTESSAATHGTDINHIYLLYIISCCYNNYLIL